MVAQPPSSQPKISYADRAKKAQNIKSPIALPSQSHSAFPPPVANPPAAQPATSWPSALVAPKLQMAKPSVIPNATNDVTHPSSISPMSPTTSDVQNTSTDLATKALSIVAAHTNPQKTPINFWNVRKEQMAAARSAAHQQQHNSHSATSHSSTVSLSSKTSSSDERLASKLPSSTPSHSNSATNASHAVAGGPSATLPVNGTATHVHLSDDDAFVVRMYPKSPELPSMDAGSWPEVGKSVPPAHPSGSANTGDTNHPNHDEAGKQDRENNHGHVPTNHSRKGEKTKWVPIPAEELQATADALAKPSRQPNHPHPPPPRTQNNFKRHNDDGPRSQGRSRPHSTTHSRMQSHAGSVQSSPRIGGPRRLPGEEGGSSNNHANDQPPPPSQPVREKESDDPPMTAPGDASPLVVKPYLQPRHQAAVPLPQPQFSEPIQHSPQHSTPESLPYHHPVPVYGSMEGYPPHDPHRLPVATYPHYMHHTYQGSRDGTPPLPYGSYPQAQGYPPAAYGPLPYGHSVRSPYDYHSQIPSYGYWSGHGSRSGSGYQTPVYAPPHIGFQQPPPAVATAHSPRTQIQDEDQGRNHRYDRKPGRVLQRRPRPPEESVPVDIVVGEEGARKVVFGSIEGSPSAAQLVPDAVNGAYEEKVSAKEDKDKEEKQFMTSVSIGVNPEDVHLPRSRSRTRTQTGSDGMDVNVGGKGKVKVIDLTEKEEEAKWEFGTVSVEGGEAETRSITPLSDKPQIDSTTQGSDIQSRSSVLPSTILNQEVPSSPSELAKRLELLSAVPTIVETDHDAERNVFEVRDFGFGFGPNSRGSAQGSRAGSRGSSSPTELQVEGVAGEGETDQLSELERTEETVDSRTRERREAEGPPRVRRYAPGPASNPGYPPHHFERGGYIRRGRNGYGRGRRGGGGYDRSMLPPSQAQRGLSPFGVQSAPGLFRPMVPSIGGDANGYYPSMPHHMNLPSMAPLGAYIPPGYEGYVGAPQVLPLLTTTTTPLTTSGLPPRLAAAAASASPITPVASNPPVPTPVSPLPFPLDSTRYYLLGQLEYYLSPQNLAQDFFLRQKMDSRGWVPIALIASFNRVRQLTPDVNVVREMLLLSTVVQVRDEWVRMIGWETFVLPDATTSIVDEGQNFPPSGLAAQDEQPSYQASGVAHGEQIPPVLLSDAGGGGSVTTREEDEGYEDEDEDEVEIVVNNDGNLTTPWSPSRRT